MIIVVFEYFGDHFSLRTDSSKKRGTVRSRLIGGGSVHLLFASLRKQARVGPRLGAGDAALREPSSCPMSCMNFKEWIGNSETEERNS